MSHHSPLPTLLRATAFGITVGASLLACSPNTGVGPSDERSDDRCEEGQDVALRVDFGERIFREPVAAIPHPSKANLWYIAERRGIVWWMERAEGVTTPRRLLDGRSLVNSDLPEGGLHGIALHPDFANNGVLFVAYSAASASSPANLETRISRFQAESDHLAVDKATEEVLLRIEQPRDDNNGGHIAFGPDGFLYIGLGDGGGPGDPDGNAQSPDSLFGKVLRIDVDTGEPYGIPESNPFASGGGRPEIYASGFRNPRRFSFDASGTLWLGDIGQDAFEEVNHVVLGGNYGWNVREGNECFGTSTCEEFSAPIATYSHDEGLGITGGFVYRGQALPELRGSYIFSDAFTGHIWSLSSDGAGAWSRKRLLADAGAITSLAEAPDGELLVLDKTSGNILSLDAPDTSGCGLAEGADAGGPITSFQQLYDQVLSVDCAPCHTQRALGGLGMVDADTAFSNLVDIPMETEDCAGRTRVIPGDAEGSGVFGKVSGVNLCGPAMPLGAMASESTQEAIRQWIEAGAQR